PAFDLYRRLALAVALHGRRPTARTNTDKLREEHAMADDLRGVAPVEHLPQDAGKQPQKGIGLCLSGGGYRAMLFHLGALWRLNELGYLPKLARVSSVSGGSITAGVLGMHWKKLAFDGAGVSPHFTEIVVAP